MHSFHSPSVAAQGGSSDSMMGIESDLHAEDDNLAVHVCDDSSEMVRCSGGQKKRVTTAEMISGPKRTLFMVASASCLSHL